MNGWEPREVTEYLYDESGRLVRCVTTREPEFTPAETALLLAYQDYAADLGPHGIPMSEAMDPANQHAFVAPNDGLPSIDFAQRAIEDAKDAYYKQWPDASRNGHKWGVMRLPALQQEPDAADDLRPGDVGDSPSL